MICGWHEKRSSRSNAVREARERHGLRVYQPKGRSHFQLSDRTNRKCVLRLAGRLRRDGLRNGLGFSYKLPDGRLRVSATV